MAQHRSLKEELVSVFADALDHAAFVGGSQVEDFEKEFARFVGSACSVGVANGTDALRLALIAMGVGPGSRVVTVPNTFIATTEAISQVGASFDFVDVDPNTCLMDPNRLEDHLRTAFAGASGRPWPSVVVPVHLYGQCAEMDAITQLARKYGLVVLEDAAQAHGASHRGRNAGALGDAAAFSFYPAKNLGACGEAGAVTTDSPQVAEKVRMLRDHGQRVKYYHALEGYNARLDAIQAGMLRIKLAHLEGWNAARREIASFYDDAFGQVDWVRTVEIKPHNVSCYHLYVIHAPQRDALQAYLKSVGIATGLHYPLPLHLQPCYAHLGLGVGAFPNAERSAAHLLSLPMFPELGLERAERVVDAVRSFPG
jgi:dTDP-4-amino-4,6-dideoxygalactose transaminase